MHSIHYYTKLNVEFEKWNMPKVIGALDGKLDYRYPHQQLSSNIYLSLNYRSRPIFCQYNNHCNSWSYSACAQEKLLQSVQDLRSVKRILQNFLVYCKTNEEFMRRWPNGKETVLFSHIQHFLSQNEGFIQDSFRGAYVIKTNKFRHHENQPNNT